MLWKDNCILALAIILPLLCFISDYYSLQISIITYKRANALATAGIEKAKADLCAIQEIQGLPPAPATLASRSQTSMAKAAEILLHGPPKVINADIKKKWTLFV